MLSPSQAAKIESYSWCECLRKAYSTPVQITIQDRPLAPTTLLSSLAQERSQPQNQCVQNKSEVRVDTAFLEILRIAQL
jgi:hypothetical protein